MTPSKQRWFVMLAGVFSMLLTVGVARFAYTPMLPLMQQQAGLGVAEGGWLAAINYMGYLSGALIAARVSSIFKKDKLYRYALILAIVTTWMMGFSNDFWWMALSRFLAGLCAAGGMLIAAALVLNWLLRHDMRSELGVHFSGIGLGIALAAAFVEITIGHLNWSQQWYGFTVVGVMLFIPAWRWLPAPSNSAVSISGKNLADNPPSKSFLCVFMVAYFCAGVGYVVSATFIVAIIDKMPGLNGAGTWAFLLLGLAATPATIVWDRVARRYGVFSAMIFAFALQFVAAVVPLFDIPLWLAIFSAVLFGSSFVGLVSLVLTLAGLYYPTKPAKMMGVMTLCYGVAQIGSPAITGVLAQITGTYHAGLYMSALAVFVGGILSCYLRLQPDAKRLAN